MYHWIQWISEEVKAEFLSTLARSREVAAIGSESTRAIGLGNLNFGISEVESVDEVVFRNPRYAKSRHDLDR